MRRIDRLGRQHRKDLFGEIAVEPVDRFLLQLGPAADHLDSRLAKGGAQGAPDVLLGGGEAIRLLADRGELLGWSEAVRGAFLDIEQLDRKSTRLNSSH